jgi:hypothetical protein
MCDVIVCVLYVKIIISMLKTGRGEVLSMGKNFFRGRKSGRLTNHLPVPEYDRWQSREPTELIPT